MSTSTLFRLSGLAAILTGLAIISQRLVFDTLLPGSLIRVGTFGPQLGLLGLTGIYLWQKEASGRLGGIGYIVNFIGLAYLGCVDFARHHVLEQIDPAVTQHLLAGPTRLIFLTIGVAFLIGVCLFGIATLRAGLFPRIAVILYMLGFIPFALSPFFPATVITVAQIIASVGIAWMGLVLWNGDVRKLQPAALGSQAM